MWPGAKTGPGLAELGNPKAEPGFSGLAQGLAQAWAVGAHKEVWARPELADLGNPQAELGVFGFSQGPGLAEMGNPQTNLGFRV